MGWQLGTYIRLKVCPVAHIGNSMYMCGILWRNDALVKVVLTYYQDVAVASETCFALLLYLIQQILLLSADF